MSDLISRQAVLMSLADYQLQESPNWGANGMGNTDAYEAITECIRVIEQAPTIDPVKRGEWLKYPGEVVSDDGLWGETLFDCSNCGHTVHVATRFCSQCGARMGSVKWRSEDAAN